MTKHSRRQFLTQTVPVTLGTTIGLSGISALGSGTPLPNEKKLKIVVAGAHPDDPETMCGGAMAIFANQGHEVVSAYLTRGEAGIEGKTREESSKIRTAEALFACEMLKVRPEFLGQIDGSCEITRERYAQMFEFLKREDPDILITHWPIDTHRDHRICSVLVYDAWLAMGMKASLYFGEVMSGEQSQNFSPTVYIDITTTVELKHKACFAHVSQQIEDMYNDSHGKMEVFRGMESGCAYAEAFVRHARSNGIHLTS
jgi:LmbE family N-acetylglucosaminyl deacetylase